MQSQPVIDDSLLQSQRRHRRETLQMILLPVLGGVLLIVILMAVVVALPRMLQVSIVADFTLTVLMLCPLVLCTLPFSVGLAVLALKSGGLHKRVAPPLRRGEALSLTLLQRAERLGDRLSRASIRLNARAAPLMRWSERAFETRSSVLPHEVKDDRPESRT